MTERAPPPPVHLPSPSRLSRIWVYACLIVMVPVATFIVLITAITPTLGLLAFRMPGGAMVPGLVEGDFFFIDTHAYGQASPRRGEVIGLYAPPALGFGGKSTTGRGPEFVKRVIGVGGDRIDMTPNGPIINGVPVTQERLGEYGGHTAPGWGKAALLRERLPDGKTYEILKYPAANPRDNGSFILPKDCYFVLGDNRDDSIDSRERVGQQAGWCVTPEDIIGRATYVYWSGFAHFDRIGLAVR